MGWLEKASEEAKERRIKREASEKAYRETLERFQKSGVLKRIENKIHQIEKETDLRFEVSPAFGSYASSIGGSAQGINDKIFEEGHGPNRIDNIGIYSVKFSNRSMEYLDSFCFYIEDQGVYFVENLHPSGPKQKKREIDPYKVTDEDIHKWFGRLVEGK